MLIPAMQIVRKRVCSLSMIPVPSSGFCIFEGLMYDAWHCYLPSLILDNIGWKFFRSPFISQSLTSLKSTKALSSASAGLS